MDFSSLNQSIEQRKAHIFRSVEGHFAHDTPANRQLLIDTVLNINNYLGKDKWGNDWYAQTRTDNTQIWVQIRKGEIINGGLNSIPRPWNSITGFSRITPP
jgi:hypothetical protein